MYCEPLKRYKQSTQKHNEYRFLKKHKILLKPFLAGYRFGAAIKGKICTEWHMASIPVGTAESDDVTNAARGAEGTKY